MRPLARQLERLMTIPGVGHIVAEVIVAETGADMSRFRTAANLASWAGVCPHHHQSAGKTQIGQDPPRQPILTAAWHMLTDNVDYHALGGDYFARLNPERAMRRIVRQANALGFTVQFDPIQTA